MNCKTWLLTGIAALAVFASPGISTAQQQTGAITGRAEDSSQAALPGVTVSITSTNLIGGARTAVTDERGVFRFTLLPGGKYSVVFTLPGFATLTVNDVDLNAGAVATVNGKMQVATLQESVTVTSQAPTIDLESSKVQVNWDQQKLDELPYARSLTGLIQLVPGLYATAIDSGGSNFGTGSGPSARTFGRSGGGVVSYDGMIWDQTYGDFGTYEEAQITTAAKGADAMNPGLTMNLVVKSGSNTFRGQGSANYESGGMQAKNVDEELTKKGYAPGSNKFTKLVDYYGEVGGPILRDKLWFYASHRDASSGNLIPGFISLADRQQVEFYTKLQDPTGKVTYQISKNNKVEGMFQFGRKWQPYRTASRYVPLESTQNQDSWSLVGPSFKYQSILSNKSTFDASLQRGGYWWPDVPWSDDVRKTDLTTSSGPTRGGFLKTDRRPRRWQYGGTYSYFASLGGKNHELKTGYLGWRNLNETDNIGYPNQQQYRYRSTTDDAINGTCNEAHNYDGCFLRPDSVLVYDYPNTTASGEWYNSAYFNDRITMSRKLTVNVGVRYDRYSSFLPEQGNPGTGPFATKNIYAYKGEDNYPIYSTIVPRISAVYDITGEGRIAVRGSYGRYVGGSSGASANPGPGADNINPNAIITKTYVNWDGSIPYVPIPGNLTTTSGGGTDQSIDPNLKGPFVDEYTAGVDVGLNKVMTVQFNYVHKIDGNGNKTINTLYPYEAFTASRTGIDPGPDNVTGTADDQTLIVYSVPSTYPNFGKTAERTIQAEGNNRYHAFGVTFNKQMQHNWSFLFSFDSDYRDLRDNAPRNPNEALYGPGTSTGTGSYQFAKPSWNYAMRLSGTYLLKWGITYAAAFNAQSGDYFFREVQIRDASNTNVAIRINPQAGRYEWTKLWDNRFAKRFKTVKSQSIEGEVNIYNTLNTNTITAQNNRVGAATYLQPTTIVAARVMKVGVKYRF